MKFRDDPLTILIVYWLKRLMLGTRHPAVLRKPPFTRLFSGINGNGWMKMFSIKKGFFFSLEICLVWVCEMFREMRKDENVDKCTLSLENRHYNFRYHTCTNCTIYISFIFVIIEVIFMNGKLKHCTSAESIITLLTNLGLN